MKLVSCIMPARGRREFAAQAVDSFLAQTYPNKELLICDDIDDPAFPGGVKTGHPILRFLSNSRSIAEKRNDLCELSAGSIIAHFDSDDWSAPDRLADQVARLEESRKAVTGYSSMIFFDGQNLGRYLGMANYALGTSLCFRREWWKWHKFPVATQIDAITQLAIGEDNEFVAEAMNQHEIMSVEGLGMMVARVHPGNSSRKNMGDYSPIDLNRLPEGFPFEGRTAQASAHISA